MAQPVSIRSLQIANASARFTRFFTESAWARHAGEPSVCDFVFGNPHEMPLAGFTQALQRWSVPQNKDWYAYKDSEHSSRIIVANSLHEQRGVVYELDDIFMTNGGFAALAVALNSVVDPGDEVIYLSPPWFFYEALIVAAGGSPIRVQVDPQSFDLDVAAIQAAITARTRAIIINSPHNPTGKIYPAETLTALARVLSEASAANGRTIYLLSDEAYCRVIFDGRSFPSPTTFYPNSFLLYTYGKTLLTPGQRIGYLALSPDMEHREALRRAVFDIQFMTGYAFPNALLQHALGDLDKLSIDIPHLQVKRDWMVKALREMGYSVHLPEGTFYLLVKSPLTDDYAFCELLAEYKVLVLPGTVAEIAGYFRVSLTANDEMIKQALPGFAAAIEHARSRVAA